MLETNKKIPRGKVLLDNLRDDGGVHYNSLYSNRLYVLLERGTVFWVNMGSSKSESKFECEYFHHSSSRFFFFYVKKFDIFAYFGEVGIRTVYGSLGWIVDWTKKLGVIMLRLSHNVQKWRQNDAYRNLSKYEKMYKSILNF